MIRSAVDAKKGTQTGPARGSSVSPLAALDEHVNGLRAFFDDFANRVDDWHVRRRGYHAAVRDIARFYVPKGASVLEIGCGTGDLLAALEPSTGVGVDLSPAMVRRAAARHPQFTFHHMTAERLTLPGQTFDYIILSDLLGYLYDIRAVFERVAALSHPGTRVVINWNSRLWQPVIHLLEWLGWKARLPYLNWTTVDDIRNLLCSVGLEPVRSRGHIIMPVTRSRLTKWMNRFVLRLPVFRQLAWTNWIVARPSRFTRAAASVTVVCPCRNEAGNIESVVRRLPALGFHTELIFVEGHSRDETLAECRRVAALYPDHDIKVMVQPGKGKGDAVRTGFAHARGDLLMILDADLSVAPEDLGQFYDVMVAGVADFAMGSRLVYAMDAKAMRFLNILGNRFFALLLGGLVGQPIKDPLCGTKVIWRRDYERLAAGRHYFGDFDPFGDFDLILGAAKLNLRIVELPVRYRERTYGTTNINRFRDGWLLLKMSAVAARRLFFVE
jgi:ubiquinone/menaquinone biosynthesis C-methylase UbiE